MVIGQERPAVGVFDTVELEAALAIELATIGYGIFDRREFQEIVFALSRANEQ